MFVSSSVSLITVSLRLLSFASRLPPGKAICPDQGSLEFRTRLTKRTRSFPPSSLRITATEAFAPCSSHTALKTFESLETAELNLNQHPMFVTLKTSACRFLNTSGSATGSFLHRFLGFLITPDPLIFMFRARPIQKGKLTDSGHTVSAIRIFSMHGKRLWHACLFRNQFAA